ncbi:MAG: LysE family translocator [Bacteroidales bacterium]|nr:LysE family translocator [Bacteroidales bacterium]
MIAIFFEGVVLGLIISITVGPAFFAIIQTGIQRGFHQGFFMALGISLSDITLIAICYLGASFIFDNPENKLYIGLVGGIVLLSFGFFTFTRKPEILLRRSSKYKTPTKRPGSLTYFFKGYFLNVINPFLFLFWLTAMGWVSSKAEEGKLLQYALTFFAGTIGTVFLTDLLKSFIGNRIKKYLRPRTMLWLNRVVGILLIGSGVVLIVRTMITWV